MTSISATAGPKLSRLTAAEFERLLPHTRMRDVSQCMARLVLVDGIAPVVVADQYKTSRQRVNKAVACVRRAHAAAGPSEGWSRVEVSMPQDLSRELMLLEEGLEETRSAPSQKRVVVGLVQAVRQARAKLVRARSRMR